MAVKIAQYENRLTPTGGLEVSASAPQVSDAIGKGLANVGTALTQMGVQDAKATEELNKRADQDDLLRAQTAMVRMQEDVVKYADDLSMNQQPGAYGYADNVRGAVQDYTKKLLEEGGWRENTKKHLAASAANFEYSMYNHAMNFEAQAGVDLRLGQIKDNSEFYQRYLLQNPDKYEETMGSIDRMIDNAALTPATKSKLKDEYRKNIALTTAAAIQEKDPELAKRIFSSAYNTTPTDEFSDIAVDPRTLDQNEWGPRPDGTKKGTGWLGVLKRPDGGVSTEISIAMDDVNGGKDFPLLVPSLNRKEVDAILAIPTDDPKFMQKVPKSAIDKAVAFAKSRAAEGKSPFAGVNETAQYQAPVPTADPIQLPQNVNLPAGLRNNNPGNIKFAGQRDAVGPSKNLDQGDPQAVYKTPEDGLNAMYGLVLKKFDGGKQTVADLISAQGGWTPGNMQAAKNIAKTMGVGVNDTIDLHDPNQLAKFGRALITQEQGPSNKYINDDQLASAAGTALGKGSMTGSTRAPTVAVTAPSDLPVWAGKLVQDIGPEKLPSLIASTEADINRLRTQFKANVITQETNDIAMFEDGKNPPKELTLGDYQKAFGDEEGAIRYQNYQSVKTLGVDKTAVRTMSNEQQDKLLGSYEPDPTRPEFYNAAKTRQAILAQAINETRQERYKDPISFAMKNKIGDLKPIDYNDMPSVGAELSKRYGVAMEMNRTYGTPFQILTPDEKNRMLEGFGKLTDQGKIAFLSTLNSSISNKAVYRSIVQQIAPDSPVTAVVGNFVGMSGPAVFKDSHWFGPDTTRAAYDPKQVALTILQGEQLLNPSKAEGKTDGRGTALELPKEDDLRTEFDSAVAGSFNNQTKEYETTYQAVKDYYAAKSAQSGAFVQDSVDKKLWHEAVEAVTGGITEVNGKTNVRRPWGMSESAFLDASRAAFDAETKRLGLNWNYGQYGLENAGNGYLVRVGNGYATYTGKDGNLHSVYITIGAPGTESVGSIPSAAPGANTKVEVDKTKKLGTK